LSAFFEGVDVIDDNQEANKIGNSQGKKLKKSTRLFYLALILGGIFVVLVIFL